LLSKEEAVKMFIEAGFEIYESETFKYASMTPGCYDFAQGIVAGKKPKIL
jgi:hypothetical protein